MKQEILKLIIEETEKMMEVSTSVLEEMYYEAKLEAYKECLDASD